MLRLSCTHDIFCCVQKTFSCGNDMTHPTAYRISPLRRLRFEIGDVSLRAFAEALGLNFSSLSRVESGAPTGLKTISALAKFCGCSLEEAMALCDGSISETDFQRLIVSINQSRGGIERGEGTNAERAPQKNSADAATRDRQTDAIAAGTDQQN